MRHILSRAHRKVLERFARSHVLLAFDYDGTLAPIVPEPGCAVMRSRTRRLLEEAASLYPCIVISGRTQRDALRRLQGVGVCEVVGNHGVEPWQATDRFIADVRRWLPVLEKELAPFPDVRIEDKMFSVAVHYRQSCEKRKARTVIRRAAASLGDVRIIGGKQIVNILPNGAPHKGIALEQERTRLQCDTAVYVGDDETDEDVFALAEPDRLLTIRIGLQRFSRAEYYIRNQKEVDDVLRVLVDLRRNSGPRQETSR